MSKANPWPEDVGAEEAPAAGHVDRRLQRPQRPRVLAAQVEPAVLAASGEGGDGHRLDDRERVALHQHAVLERAGLGLVGVAHEVVRAGRLARRRRPTCGRSGRPRRPGRPARSRSTSWITAAGPDLERPAQRLVAAGRAVVVELAGSTTPTRASSSRRRVAVLRHGGDHWRLVARPRAGRQPAQLLGRRRRQHLVAGRSPASMTSAAGARSHSPRHGDG